MKKLFISLLIPLLLLTGCENSEDNQRIANDAVNIAAIALKFAYRGTGASPFIQGHNTFLTGEGVASSITMVILASRYKVYEDQTLYANYSWNVTDPSQGLIYRGPYMSSGEDGNEHIYYLVSYPETVGVTYNLSLEVTSDYHGSKANFTYTLDIKRI